jgi:DNA-binding NtrC family response regulator
MATGWPTTRAASTDALSGVEDTMGVATAVLYVPSAARERAGVRDRLARMIPSTVVAASVNGALETLAAQRFALALFDIAEDGAVLSSIRVVRAKYPELPIAGIVDRVNPLAAGEAIDAGVTDILPWPFEERDVVTLLANVRDRVSVELLDRAGAADRHLEALFVQSQAMRLVIELIRGAAEVRGGVCVCGEAGTGRELVARAIHLQSAGQVERPFVSVDCTGAIPEDLERRLFGVSAERRVPGGSHSATERVSAASAVALALGGTLFLKNPGEASARVQAKLARLFRDGEAFIIEKRTAVELDVRPIAAVDPGVDVAVTEGHLRADLYERLAQVRIDLPPLRRRREDIPFLAIHFLKQLCEAQGIPAKGFTRSALALLTALPWRGNSTELRTLLETLVRAVARPVIQLDDLLEHASLDGIAARIDEGATLRDAKARFERDCITAVLMRHHGRVGEAAKALGIQRTNLYRKVRQLNVPRSLLSSQK